MQKDLKKIIINVDSVNDWLLLPRCEWQVTSQAFSDPN